MDPGEGPSSGKKVEKTVPQYTTFTVTTFNCTICPGSDTDSSRTFLSKAGYLQHMKNDHKDWKTHYKQRFGAPAAPPAPATSSSSSSEEEEEEESSDDDEDGEETDDDDDQDDDQDDDENSRMEIDEETVEQNDEGDSTTIKDQQSSSSSSTNGVQDEIKEVLKSKTSYETNDLEGLVLTEDQDERNEIGLSSPTTSTAETLVSTDENCNDGDDSEIKTQEKKETESKVGPQSNESSDDIKEKNDDKIEIKKDNKSTRCDDIKCSICSKNFATEEGLKEHHKYEHDEEQVCGQCTKLFPTGLSLYKHEKVHFKFPCSICEWRFRNKERLDQHWSIHFGFSSRRRREEEKLVKFKCPDAGCKRVFDSDRSLKLHVAKIHPELKSPSTPHEKKSRTSLNNSQSSSTSTSKSSLSMRATSPTNWNASMSLSSIFQKSSKSTPRNRDKNIKVKGIIGSKKYTTTPETEKNVPLPKKPTVVSITSSDDEESSSEKEVSKTQLATHQIQKVVSAMMSTLQGQKSQSQSANVNTETIQKECQEQEPHSKSTPTNTSQILKTSISTSNKAISSNSNDRLTITTTQTPVTTTTTTTTMDMSSALISLYTELDRQKLTNKNTSIPKQPVKVPAALLKLKFGSPSRPIAKTVPPVTSSSFSWPQKTPAPTPTIQDQVQETDTLATTGKTQDNLKNQTTNKNQNENDTTTTNKNQNEKDTTTKKISKAVPAALLNLKLGLSSRPIDKTVPPVATSSFSCPQKTPAPSPAKEKEPYNPSTLTLTSKLQDKDQDNSKNLNEKDTTAKEPSNPTTDTFILASNLQDKDKDNSKDLNGKGTTTNMKISKAVPAVLSILKCGPASRPLDKTVPSTMPVTSTNNSFSLTRKTSTPTPIPTTPAESSNTSTAKIQDNSNQNEKDTDTATATTNVNFTCKKIEAGTEKNNSPNILLQPSQHQLIGDCDDIDMPRSAAATHSLQNAQESGSKDINARLIELALSNVSEKKSDQNPIGDQKRRTKTRWDTETEQNCNRFQDQGQHKYQSTLRNQFSPRPLINKRLLNNRRVHFSPGQSEEFVFRTKTFGYRFPPPNSQQPGQRRQGFESLISYRLVQPNLASNLTRQRHQGPSRGIKSPAVDHQLSANLAQGIEGLAVINEFPMNSAQGIKSPAASNQFPMNSAQGIKSPAAINQFPMNSAQVIEGPAVINQFRAPTEFLSNLAQALNMPQQHHQSPSQEIISPAAVNHQFPTIQSPIPNSPQSPNHNSMDFETTVGDTEDCLVIDYNHGLDNN